MTPGANTPTRHSDLRTACLLVAAIVAVTAAIMAGGDSRSRAEALVAPELPATDTRCDAERHAAEQRAADAVVAADAHMARYPFAPAAGLRALALLAEARDCLTLAAAAGSDPDQLAQRTAHYRALVTADYRDRITRVQRALAQRELAPARDDVAYLLELLAGQQHPFVSELRGLQLELDAASANQEPP
jgi:hypothetical protein